MVPLEGFVVEAVFGEAVDEDVVEVGRWSGGVEGFLESMEEGLGVVEAGGAEKGEEGEAEDGFGAGAGEDARV